MATQTTQLPKYIYVKQQAFHHLLHKKYYNPCHERGWGGDGIVSAFEKRQLDTVYCAWFP